MGEGVGESQGDCGVVQGEEESDCSREEHALGGGGEVHWEGFGFMGDHFGAGLAEGELQEVACVEDCEGVKDG